MKKSRRRPETTGRHLVLFREGTHPRNVAGITAAAGAPRLATSSDFERAWVIDSVLAEAGAIYLDAIGVAVVDAPPAAIRAAAAPAGREVIVVEPERRVYAIGAASRRRVVRAAEAQPRWTDGEATWGLQATLADRSRLSGRGVRIAVIDTGLDLTHPDFSGRAITAASFVDTASAQDAHGHGTHCIGTACGPKGPSAPPRYGVAHESEIFAGKVLDDAGSGNDAGILAGIDWALRNRCRILSMSLGSAVAPGESYSRVYEDVARRCLDAGMLMIAAAGNESRRPRRIEPVGHPANCPSIMAVGAIDPAAEIAWFSCQGRDLDGGAVDIAGPGVDVRSSWIGPEHFKSISGTSMAAPHVAGIAALYAEKHPDATPLEIWQMLAKEALPLEGLEVADAGSGLVQAP